MTNWTVLSVACLTEFQGERDVVYSVEWCAEKANESGVSRKTGRQGITFDPTSYIPRNQLTDEILISWCKSEMGQKAVDEIEQELDR